MIDEHQCIQQINKDDGDNEYRVDLNKVCDAEKEELRPESVLMVDDSIWTVMVPKSRFAEPGIEAAMNVEVNSLRSFDAFEEVKDCGQKTLSMRWVITEKTSTGGQTVFKARLVCRGFEEAESQFEVDSPTVEKSSVRIFLALATVSLSSSESSSIPKIAIISCKDLYVCSIF